MNERDFFNEKEEVKKATYSCPHCRERGEYDVRWLKRTRKAATATRRKRTGPRAFSEIARLHRENRRHAGLQKRALPPSL